MAIPASTLEAAAYAVANMGNTISLHTADPGNVGGNEVSGGGYSRQTTYWSSGSVDGKLTGTEVTFNVPVGNYSWLGVWGPGGEFIGGRPLNVIVKRPSGGTVSFTPSVVARQTV